MRDFTLKKYKQLMLVLKDNDYHFKNVKDALSTDLNVLQEKTAIIRHDIDTKSDMSIALKMASFEMENGISATYYFRTLPHLFNKKVIREIHMMGHEIGYHYEVLALTRGDMKKGIELFRKDLSEFREICPIQTVCQHGGTLGYYSSTTLFGLLKITIDLIRKKIDLKYYPSIKIWDEYAPDDFQLLGDAYLSFNFNKVKYFSDTGLSWDDNASRIVDIVEEKDNNIQATAHKTDDLIKLIEKQNIPYINILVHPANWNENIFVWTKWLILQKIRNISKKIVKKSQ